MRECLYHRLALGLGAAMLAVAVGTTAGCSRQPSRPKTYPVHGTVIFNGKPVEGATVTFVPKDGSSAQPAPQAASAVTDAKGNYALGTFGSGDGAMVGEYLVKVAKYSPTQQPPQRADTPDSEMEAFLQFKKGVIQKTGPKNELPARYENEKTSGLFYTVQAGDNTFDIKLSN